MLVFGGVLELEVKKRQHFHQNRGLKLAVRAAQTKDLEYFITRVYRVLGGGFKYFLFSPLFGEDFQFDEYFSKGLKPPTSRVL